MVLTETEKLLILAYRDIKTDMSLRFKRIESLSACFEILKTNGRNMQCHVLITQNEDDFFEKKFELNPSVKI